MSDDHSSKQESEETAEEQSGEGMNPVKEMFILAALYLPLGFFLWFFFGSAVTVLPARLTELALVGLFPDLFEDVVQLGFQLEVQTRVMLERQVDGQIPLLNLHINPMIYAWGMAVLFGLVLATPLSAWQRVWQLAIGYLVVSVVTAWGVFWEAWKDMAFLMGPEAEAAVEASALSPTFIALFYQLGYLMLPAVVPIATWILMNRAFLEKVARNRRG